jgi:hypothetical protein
MQVNINEMMEEEKGPIWLLNKTGDLYPSGAEVYITIMNGDQSSVFMVPRTWLPIEITARHPRKQVLASSYFIAALSKGLIEYISKEEAQKILSKPTAKREQERLEAIEVAIKDAGSARGIGKNVTISTGDPDADEQDREGAKTLTLEKGVITRKSDNGIDFGEDSEEEEDPVSAGFRAWVISLNNKGDDLATLENELRMRGKMSIEEASYLLKHIENESIQAKLRRKLEKLKD